MGGHMSGIGSIAPPKNCEAAKATLLLSGFCSQSNYIASPGSVVCEGNLCDAATCCPAAASILGNININFVGYVLGVVSLLLAAGYFTLTGRREHEARSSAISQALRETSNAISEALHETSAPSGSSAASPKSRLRNLTPRSKAKRDELIWVAKTEIRE